jgi:Transmembrane secretion effector
VRPAAQRFWRDLAEGWHEVRRHRWLTSGFLGFALGNVGIGMYFVLGPLVARAHLGGAQAWGLIVTAGAVGGVIGGMVAYRFRPRHPVATAFAVWSIGAAPVLALVPPLPLPAIMVASTAFIVAIVVGNTLWETALQQEVRPDRLARVGSIDWLLSLCLMPAGQALAGPFAGQLGVRGTLLLAAALMSVPNLCVLAFVREVREVRRREAPGPAPA